MNPAQTERELDCHTKYIEHSEKRIWKNMLFMRDGRTIIGFHSFSSESQARDAIQRGELQISELLIKSQNSYVVDRNGAFLYKCAEYSHAIPVAVARGTP